MADKMTRAEFAEYMKAFEERLEERLDGRFASFEERINHSMKVQFEETRGLIRFSLEAVDALRETTERGFAEMRADHEEQTTLLKDAVKHVRQRVERLERRRG